ncbi:hypothetical protein I302_106346 [Kwoniella bestiolae CBS 10118]|uniref:Major facilitator superfamily (MFS) profile domain-containing protein n=1 Tax=Kwoniella bestiolae CBS 10118 TaxID=1296100 RepID=A0A1B9G3Q4_9TREE|nr:hypothetical protein I302_05470 [Kwoniella bestiolae CBS 10118]OCF25646.1 hypothetical protein I302_05470 [Kwoniella bestiolae CBS 10118]
MRKDEVREVLPDQTTRLPRSKLLLLFLGLQIALFLSFIDSTSVSTILPIVGADLNATSSITWAGTAFLVANTSFQVITSRLSDCFGRKIVLLGSLFLFALGDLLAGFATNKVWLYCARAVAGIGGGGINSLSMIIMSDVVTLRERGQYQSLLGIGIALGSGVGPFLGAILAEKVRWSWAFWIIAPLSALTMVLIQFTVPLKPVSGDFKEKLKSMDWIGSVLSLTMTVTILVPLSGGGSTFAWNSPVVIALFVVGGLAIIGFILVETYVAKFPLFPGRLLSNRNVCLLLLQTWLVGIVYYGGIYFVPLYLQNVKGDSPILSAALLLPLVLGQVLTTTISGFVVKWTNRTWPSFVVGFVLWTAGQGVQLCFEKGTGMGVIIGCLILQGFGIGSTIQSTLVLAQASGPSSDRAVVTGVRNFARTSGGAIGLAIGNTILQNVFLASLPDVLPQATREELAENFDSIQMLDEGMVSLVRDAYMDGLRKVFIFFVPVVALCLIMCFFIEDIPLDAPPPPVLPMKDEAEEIPRIVEQINEIDNSTASSVKITEIVVKEKVAT